jgi:GT2 family glycosyltransferase
VIKKFFKLGQIWRERGTRGTVELVYRRMVEKLWGGVIYQNWLERQRPTQLQILAACNQIVQWRSRPKFSILMPVYNVEAEWLEKAIASVCAQIYPDWELCIADDASTLPHIRKILTTYRDRDPDRIKVIFRSENGHIAAASNSALELATGDYIALLDHDDELTIDALLEVARLIQQHPEADLIYSDEDKITPAGKHFEPFFKPDWSPEYLYACMYLGHLGVYRTQIVREIGGFRVGYDGSQDYDLALRFTEQTRQIFHLPKVLYHWRTIPASAAGAPTAKPWAYAAARKALTDRLQHSAYPGWVEETPHFGIYRVRRQIIGQPLISIVIPSAGKTIATPNGPQCLLEVCLRSILDRSTYRNFEIILVDGFDIPAAVLEQLKTLFAEFNQPLFQLVRCSEPFNFSQRVNRGVATAIGQVLLLLNDDIEVITPGWLESMLELAQQREIGAVGAKLFYPDGRIQHVGVLILAGSPIHAFHGDEGDRSGYYGSSDLIRNYLAVTGACLMLRREVFDQLGGLDEALPLSFNDVDLCLKAHQAGYRNVFTPYAQLTHYESVTRAKDLQPGEWTMIRDRWRGYLAKLKGDPYYNPNLSHHDATFEFTGVGWIPLLESS